MVLQQTLRQLAVAVTLLASTQANSQPNKLHVLKINTPQQLQQYFKYTGNDSPLISGHRGGPDMNAPENSIEAMAHTLSFKPPTFLKDTRVSKDSVVVFVHHV